MDVIALSIFSSRIAAVCDEMGAVLQRAAFSPNIKDRLDFSCAVFDASGQLCAQAAHIPVHLGSLAYAMKDIVDRVQWHEGDMVVVNDPFNGGTHLPDVTVIAPIFLDATLSGFVVNRAHHANIGASTPGSMPLSCTLEEEGIVIAPTAIIERHRLNRITLAQFVGVDADKLPEKLADIEVSDNASLGDFAAQMSANRVGVQRMQALIQSLGQAEFNAALIELNDYGERVARTSLRELPDGCYCFTDYMDDDGQGQRDIVVNVAVTIKNDTVTVNFDGSSPQVKGNINCPLSVTAAGVYYVFRCLMPVNAPACAGLFRPVALEVPRGSFLNATYPAAVVAGNVETSSRIVDAVLGALAEAIPERIPAASHGGMNNVAMGAIRTDSRWDYYETIGGGMGASAKGAGLSAVQTHMTNTLNTPVEVLEQHYPLRIERYSLRKGSGGSGVHCGGEGVIREYYFLQDTQVTLLTERRSYRPWGLAGADAGTAGCNRLNEDVELPAKTYFNAKAGDKLRIETPGGGGWGKP